MARAILRRQSDGAKPVSRLHYLMVLVSLIATVIAWQMSLAGVEERTRLQFDAQADDVIHVFEEQMRRYEDVLHAGVGLVTGSDSIIPGEWQQLTKSMDLKERHPALSSLSVVYRVLPEEVASFERGQRKMRPAFRINKAFASDAAQSPSFYLPLTHIAPGLLEETFLGLDVAREPRRLAAVEKAIDSGEVQITEPIRLGEQQELGLLLIAPIYRSAEPLSIAQRREEFRGAIVASIFTQNLAAGLLETHRRQVALKVSDGREVMYNEQIAELADIDPQPLLTRSRVLPFMGRVWQFDVHSTLAFRQAQQRLEPTLILFGGLIINALLLYLLIHMAQANRRATDFGQKIAEKYDRQSDALRQSNTALEELNEGLRSFSYVVSHDLKTPLRGIAGLAQCIEEDLIDHLPADDPLQPDFVRRLGLIRKQVTLSQGLITGVLEYSGLGMDVEYRETVDVHELLNSIRVMLSVEESQLQLMGEFPVLQTYQTQLYQVFMNLIGNGFKYHGNQKEAVVTVSILSSGPAGFHRFVVSDNGPGIDPKHHEKIFEVFSTLQPKDHSMSSGVGLAIVKKLVIRHGGSISVESEPGHGASFQFDWPHEVGQSVIPTSADLPKAA